MTNEYKYKNIPLNTAASRELILELHSNTTVSRHQIVTDITKAHIERGGLPANNNPTKMVHQLLSNLKSNGIVHSISYGYWHFGSNIPSYRYTNVPLTEEIAAALILELYPGQLISTPDLYATIIESHTKQGGLHSTARDTKAIIRKALYKTLSKSNLAENISHGYWRIAGTNATAFGNSKGSNNEVIQAESAKDTNKSVSNHTPALWPMRTKQYHNRAKNITTFVEGETIGTGLSDVYVYYLPACRTLAEKEGKSFWECKIGFTKETTSARVRSQIKGVPSEITIALTIKTDKPELLEKAIHAILHLRGKHHKTSTGTEWFITNPAEIKHIYNRIC